MKRFQMAGGHLPPGLTVRAGCKALGRALRDRSCTHGSQRSLDGAKSSPYYLSGNSGSITQHPPRCSSALKNNPVWSSVSPQVPVFLGFHSERQHLESIIQSLISFAFPPSFSCLTLYPGAPWSRQLHSISFPAAPSVFPTPGAWVCLEHRSKGVSWLESPRTRPSLPVFLPQAGPCLIQPPRIPKKVLPGEESVERKNWGKTKALERKQKGFFFLPSKNRNEIYSWGSGKKSWGMRVEIIKSWNHGIGWKGILRSFNSTLCHEQGQIP